MGELAQLWAQAQPLLPLALALSLAGLLSGGIGGLFGVGGGAVLVPVLYQLFLFLGVDHGVCMQMAVGTSLGIIVPTSLRSLQSHLKHDAVDVAYLRKIALWVLLGVLFGSLAARFVSGGVMRGVFSLLAFLMALNMIFGRESWRLGEHLPKAPLLQLLGGGIGFFSLLMGIGGGVFNNILMTLYGHNIHRAVGTSSGIGVTIAIPGAVGMMLAGAGRADLPAFSIGFVSLLGVALVIPTSLFAVPYGAKLAHRLSKKHLRRAFSAFLLLVSLRFFLSLL